MSRKILFLNIFILIIATAPSSSGFTFSKAIQENGKSYIVDLHGERWDVTQAKSIGFDPERFRHGIGRNAFTPLDDSHLKDKHPNISKDGCPSSFQTIGAGANGRQSTRSRGLWIK